MASSSQLPSTFACTKPIDFTKSIDTGKLKDKSVVITGGANGLGFGCATAFAEAGAYVTILDINEEKGNAAANGLKEKGYHVQFTQTDVTSFDSQLAGFKSALSFSPSHTIDIVLTCAGLTGGPLRAWLENATSESAPADPSPPQIKTLDVNFTGVFYTAHLALFYFKQTQQKGQTNDSKHLILVSSIAGYGPIYSTCDYVASKFGVRGIWKSLRRQTHILGHDTAFRANMIAPTFIATDMTKELDAFVKGLGCEFGEVADVVAGVMRISCDEEVSGRALVIAPGKEVPGDRNFDACDDYDGLDGSREFLAKIQDGTLRNLELLSLEKPPA